MVFKPDEVRIKRAAAGRQILTKQEKGKEEKWQKWRKRGFQQQPKLASIQTIINQVLSNNCNLEKDICPN